MSDLGSKSGLKAGDAKGLRLAAVVASFNRVYTARLLASAEARVRALGGRLERVEWVPGALELPVAAQWLAAQGYDGLVALGCVIRGDTSHYDLVCEGALQGLQRVSLDSGVPVAFGVITTENKAQALARCSGGTLDAGRHAGECAVAMARLKQRLAGASRPRKKGN
jgi:6,7-dimethyl-8-ribityllumazine synthase